MQRSYGLARRQLGGSDPRTFWAARSQKSGVALPPSSVIARCDFRELPLCISKSPNSIHRLRVKILVQTTVQDIILTFVTVMPEADRLWRTLGEKESHGVTPKVLEFSKKI
jgi:hypothetical protein